MTHRAMVDGQAAEAALELVAVGDRAHTVSPCRLVSWQEVEIGRPAPLLPALGIAGAHEEPIRPGVKARRVAELREVLPDAQQRLLRRILGEVDVAQDPARHGKEPIGDLGGKDGVRLPVTMLGSDHEIGIHASSALWHRFIPMHVHGMGPKGRWELQSSSATARCLWQRCDDGRDGDLAGDQLNTCDPGVRGPTACGRARGTHPQRRQARGELEERVALGIHRDP